MSWYEEFGEQVRPDVPLAPLTWFGVGGPAKYLVQPRDAEQLRAIVARLKEQEIPIYVLGAGANVLVKDSGVDGSVVLLNSPEFKKVRIEGNKVTAGAGKDVQKLLLECTHAGLSGLECLAGIPGSVGGEIKMNAGGAFGDIGSAVHSVTVMDIHGHTVVRERDDLLFEYRKSNIAAKFVLEATFALAEDDRHRVMAKVKEIWMYKKNSQPLADHSAGCIFKNPRVGGAGGEGGDKIALGPAGQPLSAGAMIDQAGLKGLAVGGAEVSTKHANFIVAKKGSSAGDVLALIEQVREKVREKFHVKLETEVVIW